MTLLLVMLGAAVGAPCRWLLDRFIGSRHDSVFPWGTFTINMLGSLLLGAVLALTTSGTIPVAYAALLGTGFCGGFTTFSTFGFETVRLAEGGSQVEAWINVGASMLVGLIAATIGWFAASTLL